MFSNKTLATKLKNNLLTFGLVVSLVGFSGSLLAFSQNLDTSKNTQVLGATSGKEGYDLRFNANTNGALVFAGNTLCLSEETASHGVVVLLLAATPIRLIQILRLKQQELQQIGKTMAQLLSW
jgi:hypothetical protein